MERIVKKGRFKLYIELNNHRYGYDIDAKNARLEFEPHKNYLFFHIDISPINDNQKTDCRLIFSNIESVTNIKIQDRHISSDLDSFDKNSYTSAIDNLILNMHYNNEIFKFNKFQINQ